MKTLFIFSAFLMMSIHASAGGVCTNDDLNPGFAQLCQLQGTNGGKTACVITSGCRWISLTSNGICHNNDANPGFAQLCQLQGVNGGKSACDITTGCEWIDLDQ